MKKLLITILLLIAQISLFADSIVLLTDSSTNNKKIIYTNTFLLNGIWAQKTQGMGVKYIGLFYLTKNPKIGLGPSIFLEKIMFQKQVTLPINTIEARMAFMTPGLEVAYRFNKRIVTQIGFSLLLGQEEIKTIYYFYTKPDPLQPSIIESTIKTKEEKISGLQLEQAVFYQPASKEKYNVKIGLGIFERFINSSFYASDFGVKFYAGFCF